MKSYIALDVDGTMIDSLNEVYNRTCEAWEATYDSEYPFDYEYFRKDIRPNIIDVKDIFDLSDKLNDSTKLGYTERARKNFYRIREERIINDEEGWLEENRMYEGVPEMCKDLSSMGVLQVVVSAKNGDAIRRLLGHHNLLKFIDSIIDKDYGKRDEQFATLRNFYKTGKPFAYDDIAENLRIARDNYIFPIAAPQGYDKNERLGMYIMAEPRNVPKVVENELAYGY